MKANALMSIKQRSVEQDTNVSALWNQEFITNYQNGSHLAQELPSSALV